MVVALLIGLIGIGNLVVGAFSFVTLNSFGLSSRISGLSSDIDSIDARLIKTVELRESLSELKSSTLEELNFFDDYNQMLNLIPIYFIAFGVLFLAISLVVYFVTRSENKSKNP